VRFSRNLSDRFSHPPPAADRRAFSWSDTATTGCRERAFATSTAVHDAPFRPREVARIEACGARPVAKTHRCRAMSTRFCIVAEPVTCGRLVLFDSAVREHKRETGSASPGDP
jgi:hypothetical protein